ncbi:leucine-rich repeat and guanylate kinase domain-containing protein isoform X2 [Orussus abietinus]|uniref:leucine-rich repeat and guanylate kinase domain-containing protein isoform X2 n=1 Tax=Orussus abietinus TaxID=222816 RepID=UPI0006256B5C|nr:leucine-rich repeat and guanylate kinase domain-containing protein isoform X2 [Orussus abietinus]
MLQKKYLFSSEFVIAERKNTQVNENIQRKHEKYTMPLHRIDSLDKLTHDEMSWGSQQSVYVPHEVTLQCSSEGDSSSLSTSFTSSSISDDCEWPLNVGNEKREKIIQNKWGGYALDIELWADRNSPVVNILNRREMELTPSEFCGILSDRMVGACSSFLTKCPENETLILSKCELRKMNLVDISILRHHRYLQYLDLTHNKLTDLSPLGGIPYLMYLNVSRNRLKSVLKFTPPWYLTYVNLSYNNITEIDDLSEFWSIVRLDLSHNAIEQITGLHNLKHLRYLNLSYNLIKCIENLDKLNIQELNLEYNCITTFKSADPRLSLNTLANLRTLLLGHNKLSTLEFFKDAYALRIVDLKYNKIADLLEVSYLSGLVYEVDFRGNPCTKWPNYRDVLLFSMPSVMYVDGGEVSVTEKISASTLFKPTLDLLAARSITKLTLLEQLNPPNIGMHVTPYDQTCPPVVVLSGPSAVKKISLALKIADTLSNRVKYCPSHTTRDLISFDEDPRSYHFIGREEFNEMARRGEFCSIQEYLGDSYGFHISELAALAAEQKIGIAQMDLSGSLQLQSQYANVKIVLVLTKDRELHKQRLMEKFQIFTWVKDSIENLLAVKIGRRDANRESTESTSSKLDYISEILNDVIDDLDLPLYSTNIRPQGTGATTTDIIFQSQTMLPKVLKIRSQLEIEERKHISFKMDGDVENTSTCSNEMAEPPSPKYLGLKVILDEKSNIIIDDAETKRKKHRARVLFRHNAFEIIDDLPAPDEEFGESLSSEESMADLLRRKLAKPEDLKNMYVETVLASRNLYERYHKNNPGFYSLVKFVYFEKSKKRINYDTRYVIMESANS